MVTRRMRDGGYRERYEIQNRRVACVVCVSVSFTLATSLSLCRLQRS